ncbi:GGDEF domain-containing protein [Amycolatopsis rhabdoformis]|uniref:GGDEF domain-containing protein n=1 Tax=Amycolatopsis rhabdoformis TaxID=1448059 RepID=A0ABZ1I9U6_9PSEU|nr:GGDEF domain-containing protein [Amycolatopsis rhabdoformis]WSE31231.1 GGDEF domain-containing protein [Amycolatopsis rhabdoformis]
MVGDPAAAGAGRRRRVAVAGWELWRVRTRALVVCVDVVALAATVAVAVLVPVPLTGTSRFAVLVAGLLVSAELSRSAERGRGETLLGPGFGTPWVFAGAVVLPPVAAVALAVVSGAHRWLRVRRQPLYRQVFEVAATALAVLLAGRFLALTVPLPPSSLGDVRLMGLLVVGALVFTLVDAVLTGIVRGYRRPASAVLFDLTMAGLGIALAWAVVDAPLVVPLLAAALVVLHRGGVGANEKAEPTADAGTGALTASAWWDAARVQPAPAYSVLVLDLDRFGEVNARHGRRTGDAVLRAIADALRTEVRAADLVGRSGGGEFAVFLPGTKPFDALAIAERIRLRVASTAVALKAPYGTPQFAWATVSVGVASCPVDGGTPDTVFAAAVKAVRRAKAQGRNRTVCAE